MSDIFKKKNSADPEEKKIFVVNEKETAFAVTEAFRHLMTNVGFAIPKKEYGTGKVICVTSSVANEGKSTVSVNLALAFAHSGAKTILVDCDMRKPSVRNYFDIKTEKGIINYLSGEVALEEVIKKDENSGLDLLFCRQSAPNPVFLLNADTFSEMIGMLEKEYEYVIIDTPPVNIVADAIVIGKQCDGVVCVTRRSYSNHKEIKSALEQLEFAGCRFLGFVLNDVPVAKTAYYSKKHGYAYGYKS